MTRRTRRTRRAPVSDRRVTFDRAVWTKPLASAADAALPLWTLNRGDPSRSGVPRHVGAPALDGSGKRPRLRPHPSVGFGSVWSPPYTDGTTVHDSRATNQSGGRARANPVAQNGSDPTQPPAAIRARAARTSSPICTRVPARASARECRCEGRRQCRSDTRDPRRAAVLLLVAEGASWLAAYRATRIDPVIAPVRMTA